MIVYNTQSETYVTYNTVVKDILDIQLIFVAEYFKKLLILNFINLCTFVWKSNLSAYPTLMKNVSDIVSASGSAGVGKYLSFLSLLYLKLLDLAEYTCTPKKKKLCIITFCSKVILH